MSDCNAFQDDLEIVARAHARWAERLSDTLSLLLRTPVAIELRSTECAPYAELAIETETPRFLAVVRMAPHPAEIVFEIDPQFLFAMIDRLLGASSPTGEALRTPTRIERRVALGLLEKCISTYAVVCRRSMGVEPRLESLSTQPRNARSAPSDECMTVVGIRTELLGVAGSLRVWIPSKAAARLWGRPRPEIESCLREVDVPLSAVLGRATSTCDATSRLAVGDVIALGTHASQPILVFVGTKATFHALPGRRGTRRALRLTARVDRDKGALDHE